jgi:hypothetical protein
MEGDQGVDLLRTSFVNRAAAVNLCGFNVAFGTLRDLAISGRIMPILPKEHQVEIVISSFLFFRLT